MTIDRYTKALLTVIAVCLVWLCVMLTPVGTAVHAQPDVQDVRIVGVKHPGFELPSTSRFGPRRSPELLGDWDALPTYEGYRAYPPASR